MAKRKMKVLDQLNERFDALTTAWAIGNATGIPCTTSKTLKLRSLHDLRSFEEGISVTDPRTPHVLRQIADILEEFF